MDDEYIVVWVEISLAILHTSLNMYYGCEFENVTQISNNKWSVLQHRLLALHETQTVVWSPLLVWFISYNTSSYTELSMHEKSWMWTALNDVHKAKDCERGMTEDIKVLFYFIRPGWISSSPHIRPSQLDLQETPYLSKMTFSHPFGRSSQGSVSCF